MDGIILCALLLAGAFIGTSTPALAAGRVENDLKNGKRVFGTTCFACHGKNGKGALPGVPDLTKKGPPLTKDDKVLIKNIIEGFQSPGSPLAMPPKGGNPTLSRKDIRDTIAYMRAGFSTN